MSTGGGTTTKNSVQTTDPWGPAKPYLTDLLGQAQNLYNNSSQDIQYAPFNTVAPLSDQTQAALNATFQRAMNGSPLMAAADRSLTGLMQPQTAPGNAALQNLASGYGDPGMGLTGAGAGANPYLADVAGGLGRMNAALPLAAGLAMGGPSISSAVNPYLEQMYQAAAQPVIDSVNSVFGQAGRTGSGAQQQELTRDLGGLAANIYGNNYNQAVQNQLGATSLLGNLSAGDLGRNEDIANQLAGFGEAQMNRNLSAGQQLSTDALNQATMRANAAGALNSQFNTQNNLMLNAAQMAPGLANQDYTDLQNALMAGGAYDRQAQNQISDLFARWQYQQQQPWNLLDNYSGLITGLGGMGGTVTGSESVKQPGQSLIPTLISGAMGSAGLFGSGGFLPGAKTFFG